MYVGKAKNIKNRLSSYKLTSSLLPKTLALVKEAHFTRFITTPNELTSQLLEAKLIQTHQPDYNIRLKDDKSPIYIGITKENFPKVLLIRKPLINKQHFSSVFGPFASRNKTRLLTKLTRKLFPFCNANRQQKNACMYYHLELCPGVCCQKISRQDYSKQINRIKSFLGAKNTKLIHNLTQSIQDLSSDHKYEAADHLKKQLESVKYWLTVKQISSIDSLPNLTDDIAYHKLTELQNLLIDKLSLPREYKLTRIEGYDVSNIQGKFAATSMVVFISGRADKSEYRRFKIKSLDHPNDPAMLKEAIQRRFNHHEWKSPQLLLIDGGKPQLNAAIKALSTNIPVVSLVKNPDRLIMIVFKNNKNTYLQIKLPPQSPYASLLRQIRDESHRFAKSYHKILHLKIYSK